MANGDRSEFLAKKLTYVFSYDLSLEVQVESAMQVSSGFRIDARSCGRPAPPLFNVLGRDTVDGADGRSYDAPQGEVVEVAEATSFRDEDGIGSLKGRLLIRTEKSLFIAACYNGVVRVDPTLDTHSFPSSAIRRHASGVFRGKVHLAYQFETADPRYRWLNERSHVAFGEITLKADDKKGCAQEVALDVYMAL